MSFEEESYSELRRVARSLCQKERFSLTLQPTALVHEAFLRLRKYKHAHKSIGDYIPLAVNAMKEALLDYHRRRRAARRGGDGLVRVELTEALIPKIQPNPHLW